MKERLQTGLTAFATVAAHGSFTRAAAELETSPSALSQAVRQLEDRLGVRLLNRTTRRVGLTEAGRELLARVTPAMDQIQAALTQALDRPERPAGTLRVTLPRICSATILQPRLAAFMRRYPDIDLEISVDDGFVDIVRENFDAGIRLGESVERDMVAVPLNRPQAYMVVGSPEYFARHPPLREPEDLEAHDCIRYRFIARGTIYRWEFVRRGKEFEIGVRGSLTVNDPDLMLRAALDGLGLAYLPADHVQVQLQAGKLKRALARYSPEFPAYYLYYPNRAHLPAKLQAFRDHMRNK